MLGQIYYEADPFNLLQYEKKIYDNRALISPLIIRPSFMSNSKKKTERWSITARAEYFEIDNAPNIENSASRWIGKGISRYRSLRVGYSNSFLDSFHFGFKRPNNSACT